MLWTLAKIFIALGIYGFGIEPRFVVTNRETATIPNLPPAWEGKRVAVFADLQIGMFMANTDAARKAVERTIEAQPAFVLIAGDFVYGYSTDTAVVRGRLRKVISILQPLLDDSLPVYAVLGNHDYLLMNEHSNEEDFVAHEVRQFLTAAGVHVVDNMVVPLTRNGRLRVPGDTLYLAGIGEKWANEDLAPETMAKVPHGAPRVVFMHDPDSFVKIPAGDAPFAVAAHTHGMQLGIPWVTDYLWKHHYSAVGSGVEGWQKNFGEPGNNVYITRGIGFSVVAARINAVPELTVFTLHRPDSQ